MRRPSFQFYPADWLQDTGMRACSLAARGLWIDAMCFMHQGSPYGHLTLPAVKDGQKDALRPILTPILARMVGSATEEVECLIAELESAGVFSRTPEGVIYSRRMVCDEELRQLRAAGGVKSQNNPNVPRQKDARKDTLQPSLPPSFGVSPSSSPSSSKSSISSNAGASDDPDLRDALQSIWDYYIVKVGKDPKIYSFTKLRNQKGMARLKECIGKTETLADAVALMKAAVDGLVSSSWHMGQDAKTHGRKYCDWEKNLFKSFEQMEGWWNQ